MGQERLGGDLSIAVDPHNSSIVWIAWCDRVGGASGTDWTMHVRRSTDRGQTWSDDLRTITNAKNPALAVNSSSVLGLLLPAVHRHPVGDHARADRRTAWATPPTTIVLHPAPSARRPGAFFPYIGDYIRMLAVGTNFYGVFCGNNTPDMANFPSGVTYQRGAELGDEDAAEHGRRDPGGGVDRPVLLPLDAAVGRSRAA